jgi:acetyl esterase/lipase
MSETAWGWVFLGVSAFGALFTLNAFLPAKRAASLVPSFMAGWLTNELAPHHLVWQALATVFFISRGALHSWAGWVGLALVLIQWVALAVLVRTALKAGEVVERALAEAIGAGYRTELGERPLGDGRSDTVPLSELAVPVPRKGRDVERIRNVSYGEGGKRMRLDIHRHRDHPTGAPTLLQIHGGAWVIGRKEEQGQPLLALMPSHGWVCFNADYGLSPRVTFPEHLIDLKRALAWIRAHGAEYGADPDFIVVTGGSAGGHLCSLLALTPNDPEYQPGFEEVDTSVQGCIPYYGVYDFTNRSQAWHKDGFQRFLERMVMKVPFETDREAYVKASPIDRVNPAAPPFFVIHGTKDSLAPVADARLFVAKLRAVSSQPVAFAELPGTQHAFDIFPSIRSAAVIRGAERFGDWVHARHVQERVRDLGVEVPQVGGKGASASADKGV